VTSSAPCNRNHAEESLPRKAQAEIARGGGAAQLLKTAREEAEAETLVAAQEWQQDSPAQLADKEKEKEATMGDADLLRELMNDRRRWDGMQLRIPDKIRLSLFRLDYGGAVTRMRREPGDSRDQSLQERLRIRGRIGGGCGFVVWGGVVP
jgi:hypothetical protein